VAVDGEYARSLNEVAQLIAERVNTRMATVINAR
jgi:hypothetical protein